MNERKMKVLITRPLPPNPLIEERLRNFQEKFDVYLGSPEKFMAREEILERVKDVEGLISHGSDQVNAELLQQAPHLKVVAHFGAGYDAVDVQTATQRGVWVANTPGAVTEATADIALALLLSACRRLSEAEAFVRSGQWARNGIDVTSFWGNSPQHKTLAIIGLGNIGQALAARASALRMKIIYHNRQQLDRETEERLGARYVGSLDELLPQADFISVHVPLSPSTRHLLDTPQFQRMKDGRGPIIREEALVNALKSGKVRGAGLDVFEDEPKVHEELLKMPNVTLLPHIGSATIETRSAMFILQLDNVEACLERGRPLTPVNQIEHK